MIRRGLVRPPVSNLAVPALLTRLIESGVWPGSWEASLKQNCKPVVLETQVKCFAPEERGLYLYAPPFSTLESEICYVDHSLDSELALHEVCPARTLVIGDFMFGSDTVLALDYRSDLDDPSVIRLQWRQPIAPNRWVPVADDFASFCAMIGLALD